MHVHTFVFSVRHVIQKTCVHLCIKTCWYRDTGTRLHSSPIKTPLGLCPGHWSDFRSAWLNSIWWFLPSRSKISFPFDMSYWNKNLVWPTIWIRDWFRHFEFIKTFTILVTSYQLFIEPTYWVTKKTFTSSWIHSSLLAINSIFDCHIFCETVTGTIWQTGINANASN